MNEFPKQNSINPATLVEEEEDEGDIYEVEKILDCITDENGEIFYLVKWLGYDDPKDLTWEPFDHLEKCQQLIQEFYEEKKKKELSSKEKKSPRKKDSKREKKQNENQAIKINLSNQILGNANVKNLNELKYQQLQKENAIFLKDDSNQNPELKQIDMLWFTQKYNFDPKKKLFINNIFSKDGNLLIELKDNEDNTSVYEYSLISNLFPDAVLEYLESNIM